MPNVEALLRDHVVLGVDCVDRLYLNGYVPRLQRPQNLWWFFHEHRRQPVMSPVLLSRMSEAFVAAIHAFAKRENVPIVHFEKGQKKEDVAQEHLTRFKHHEGVVMIGVAQEMVSGFRAVQKNKRPGRRRGSRVGRDPMYAFFRGPVHVNQYYFYILDGDFGLSFVKFSSYAPFNVRVWLNGHEWAKRRLQEQGVAFEPLDNGFASCADPRALQKVCDAFGHTHVETFFRRWLRRLPHPFTRDDRRAGFLYSLSILQMEASLTQVFDRPLHGREFFEEVIRDNLDIGRPDRVQLIFERRVTRRTPGTFRTRVLTDGVQPSLRFDYKQTKVKQYFKLGRALRTETTFHDTHDFGVGRGLRNLERLKTIGRNINHRLLSLERAAHNCALTANTVERVVLPTVENGQRAPGIRWGDPRAMAIFSALAGFAFAPEGFTNRTLRPRVAALHDAGPNGYTPDRMSYDLRRLRLKHIVRRIPHSNRYVLTDMGRRISLHFSKVHSRVLRPILQRLDPALPDEAPDKLRRAWTRWEQALDQALQNARMVA
jgi:hypothetical protein